jgi:phage tail sheath protein FI
MPVTTSYPGIYIQELASSVHTIAAAPTNIAVFIGYTHPLKTVPVNWGKPVELFGFTDYERQFGGFFRSTAYAVAGSIKTTDLTATNGGVGATTTFGDMASAVYQFFLNGGTDAFVVGLQPSSTPVTLATLTFGNVTFTALEVTDDKWEMSLTVRPVPVSIKTSPPPASPPTGAAQADIIITYGPKPTTSSGAQKPPGTISETYRRVTLTRFESDGVTPDPNYIGTRIGTSLTNRVSNLVTVAVTVGSPAGSFPGVTQNAVFPSSLIVPDPTTIFSAADFDTILQPDTPLDKLPIFNIMSIPGVTNNAVLSTALAFCERKRAFLVVDPPVTDSADGFDPAFPNRIQDTIGAGLIPEGPNAAFYFPYLLSLDPLTGSALNPSTGLTNEIPPGPTVAGLYAATDLARGVWKAPAGFQTITNNTVGAVERGRMTDQRQGVLNPIGINCLRDFPNIPTVVFGARTLVTLTNEQWRYVPVRRMALFLEQSLYAGLGWVVFEPNAEPLWTAITMSVTNFMLGLFKQGAFAGTTPSTAFNVSCNAQTTTPDDVNNGIVNIVVAFAPLKPAEFVVITIAQLAGQAQSA